MIQGDSDAKEVLQRHGHLASERSPWETHWEEVAERVMPAARDFVGKKSQGAKRSELMFDSTAALGLMRFAAAMQSYLVPPTQRWHRLRASDPALADDQEVKEYLDNVTDILFAMRYAPTANFQNQFHEVLLSLGAFGTCGLFVDEAVGRGMTYKSIFLGELFIAENAVGAIDYVHRKYELTARQAAIEFGIENLPEKIAKDVNDKPFEKHEFLHCVRPNYELKPGRMDASGMALQSLHIAVHGVKTIRRSGYRTMPYAVSRYVTSSRETYGRSPAMLALPEIKTVNEQRKTMLRAGHRAVDPPLLLADDGELSVFSTRPNALNYGAMNMQGQPLVQPLNSGANLPTGFELTEDTRRAINDHFLVSLFQILVDRPDRMTATEAMLRAQEKGALLAPMMSRQHSELLAPMIERELSIAAAAGQLPPMPAALRERGGDVRVEYESPLTRIMESEEGVGIMRTVEVAAPIANIEPKALRGVRWEKLFQRMAEITGVRAKYIVSEEELAEAEEAEAQQQQLAQFVDSAPAAANAAKQLAQAQQIAASSPGVAATL